MISLSAIPPTPSELTPGFVWEKYRIQPQISTALADGFFGSLLFGNSQYNYVLWTIQIELIGSMLVFGFLALFGRSRWGGIAASVLVIALCIGVRDPGTYLAMFIAGAYLNKVPSRYLSAMIGLPALLIALYLGSYKSNAPLYTPVVWSANTFQESTGIALFWPVVFELVASSALIVAVLSLRSLQHLLNLKPFSWLGRCSFSLYLTHTFVLSAIAPAVFSAVMVSQGYAAAAAAAIASTVIISLLVAEPFQRAFDLPAIRLANTIATAEDHRSGTATRPKIIGP